MPESNPEHVPSGLKPHQADSSPDYSAVWELTDEQVLDVLTKALLGVNPQDDLPPPPDDATPAVDLPAPELSDEEQAFVSDVLGDEH